LTDNLIISEVRFDWLPVVYFSGEGAIVRVLTCSAYFSPLAQVICMRKKALAKAKKDDEERKHGTKSTRSLAAITPTAASTAASTAARTATGIAKPSPKGRSRGLSASKMAGSFRAVLNHASPSHSDQPQRRMERSFSAPSMKKAALDERTNSQKAEEEKQPSLCKLLTPSPAQFMVGFAMVGRGEFAYLVAETMNKAILPNKDPAATRQKMMRDEVYSVVMWALIMYGKDLGGGGAEWGRERERERGIRRTRVVAGGVCGRVDGGWRPLN
jgi:hypothetical protein